MSGIAGIIHFDGEPVEPGAIERMTHAMAFRGPDGISHLRRGNIALAHCMLRTTPESLQEVQPLESADGHLLLVCDGRVDNPDELRGELVRAGARLRSRTDAELVLHAYAQWGDHCANRIEGDFAFVVWDARRRAAFCARDRAGIRRFHYHWDGTRFTFATDPGAILAAGRIPKRLDERIVAEHLGLQMCALDATIWQGVTRLLPAHKMVVAGAAPTPARYWLPDFDARLPCKTHEDYMAFYRELLMDVVRRACRAAHPVGIDVSGGLDSSALFALADRLARNGTLPAPALNGYHLHIVDDVRADESDYCRLVGSHVARPIREIPPEIVSLEDMRDYASRFLEMPELPHYAMTRSIERAKRADGCRVSITGLGGDEWAGGFPEYTDAVRQLDARMLFELVVSDAKRAGWLRVLLRVIRHGIAPCVPGLRELLRPRPRATPHLELLSLATQEVFARQMSVSADFSAASTAGIARSIQMELLAGDRFMNFEIAELQSASMGLELRAPFWNHRFIEAAVATPQVLRRRYGCNKWLHRQAMTGLLPPEVLDRRSKGLFTCIFDHYQPMMRDAIRAEVAPRHAARINVVEIERALAGQRGEPLSKREDRVLWSLFGIDAVARAAGVSNS